MFWFDEYRVWLTEAQSLHNAQIIVNYFKGTDWTRQALSAMLGNMRHESSVNPNMYEYGFEWTQDRGYGLVQWTPRSKYWDWAVTNGLDPNKGESQLARLTYEVENNIQYYATTDYPETFSEFRSSTKGLEYLTNAFCWNYERPNRTAGETSMPSRIAFAERCFNELDFEGSGGGGSPLPPGKQENKIYELWLSGALKW